VCGIEKYGVTLLHSLRRGYNVTFGNDGKVKCFKFGD